MPNSLSSRTLRRLVCAFLVLATPFLSSFGTNTLPSVLAASQPVAGPTRSVAGCTSGNGFGLTAGDNQLIGELQQSAAGKAQIACHSATGKVRFFAAPAGQTVPTGANLPATASAEDTARAFMTRYGAIFGIRDQATELALLKNLPDRTTGKTFIRFQQKYAGVPVVGGEMIVQVDQNRQVVSAGGEFTPTPVINVTPRVTAAQAQSDALAILARQYKLNSRDLVAGPAELWIYDSRLLNGGTMFPHQLVWRFEVTPRNATQLKEPFRELVLADANFSGKIALHFNQLAEAKKRIICDANNTIPAIPGDEPDCGSPGTTVVRTEGGASSTITDVNLAYDYSGDTYDFYNQVLGRDSLDDHGLPLKNTVRYCPDAGDCPFLNAFWNGTQMFYGDGFATADDVVGHELTHGFTQYSSNLLYYYQSGAINESMSDVFGELVDQWDGVDGYAGNGSDVKWLIGEDLPPVFFQGAPNGAIRSMKDPTVYQNPDRTSSSYYDLDSFGLDNGGVHTNSGINNKAAYLISDGTANEPGGAFNGQTITGLGLVKTAHLYYELELHLLTSGSDYQDMYNYLPQACRNLIGYYGFVATDCDQVQKAVTATEMNTTPTQAPAPEAPICSVPNTNQDIFYDNLENPASGNWQSGIITGSYQAWYYPGDQNSFGVGPYATSGTKNFWGDDSYTVTDSYIGMKTGVAIPANAYLHFRHAYGFDNDGANTYDGGVIEYSADNGATWTDAGSLITDNGYNSTIPNQYQNPLGGRPAFGLNSNGYYSSRLNLSSLSGKTLRFRFRIGTDNSFGYYGWFIDDIRIYTCGSTRATSATLSSTGHNITSGQSFTLTAYEQAGGGTPPGGSVEFKDGANSLGTATLDASGVATLTTSLSVSGAHQITAVYQGGSGFGGNTSKPLTVVVIPVGCANPLAVSQGGDDNSCGTLRLALAVASNNPAAPGSGKVVDLSGLSAGVVINLNQANLVVGAGITVQRPCGSSGPDITIQPGNGVIGNGLILQGATLKGVAVRGFSGQQIVAQGQGNRLSCVKASKS